MVRECAGLSDLDRGLGQACALGLRGEVQYALGDYEMALEHHNKALIIRRTTLGERHQQTADNSVFKSKQGYAATIKS